MSITKQLSTEIEKELLLGKTNLLETVNVNVNGHQRQLLQKVEVKVQKEFNPIIDRS